MKKVPLAYYICCTVVFVVLTAATVVAQPVNDAIKAVADRLESEQFYLGNWLDEEDFTGSIVAGLVSAYEVTNNRAHKVSAELGGDYILPFSDNYYGDEAFALARLNQIATLADPNRSKWRLAVQDFYVYVYAWGADDYISQYAGIDPSIAVFYLSYHVVASYSIDAIDKETWRGALIYYLSQVDDESAFPVMAMGVATWALAQTGPLDGDMLIDPSGTGAAYWSGVTLADLPQLLLSHQVSDGDPNQQGSFYWRFDHGNEDSESNVAGYTEDTIFGALGLAAAANANPDLDLNAALIAARKALLRGIDSEGKVYEHLSQTGAIYNAYAGEMLQAICELAGVAEPEPGI
jgi:hypothetical protein